MEVTIKHMNYDEAKQISKWIYKEPYSIYSMDGSDNCINELLNGTYFSAFDKENNLIGYYCFGESAQVPVGNELILHNCARIVGYTNIISDILLMREEVTKWIR